MLSRNWTFLLGAAALMLGSLTGLGTAAKAATLDVGVWNGTSGCCSFGVRGYWFTAPTDFTITGLSVPTNGSGDDATLEVLRLDAVPPLFSSTTNDFVQLGYWEGSANVAANIGVSAGDIIGVLGWADGMTPYGDGPYATTLAGLDITLGRFGFQDLGEAYNVWSQGAGPIGLIGLEYEVGITPIPLPAALPLFLAGIAGLGFMGWRKNRRAAQAQQA